MKDEHVHPEEEALIDVLAIVRELGWSQDRITALRNTCAAAATKETLPEAERKFAQAIADALSGRSAGIIPAHMAILEQAELV